MKERASIQILNVLGLCSFSNAFPPRGLCSVCLQWPRLAGARPHVQSAVALAGLPSAAEGTVSHAARLALTSEGYGSRFSRREETDAAVELRFEGEPAPRATAVGG